MNQSEYALYVNLQKALQGKYIILCKVRIEDFVDVTRENYKSRQEIFGLRNRIKSRHVDFLICDFQTTRPLLAIELDGYSHNHPRRIQRDNFIDDLYGSVGLPIEHIRVGSDFYEFSQRIYLDLAKQPVSTIA